MHKPAALILAAFAVVVGLFLGLRPVHDHGYDTNYSCGSAFLPSNTDVERTAHDYVVKTLPNLIRFQKSVGNSTAGIWHRSFAAAKIGADKSCRGPLAMPRYSAFGALFGGLAAAAAVGVSSGLRDRRRTPVREVAGSADRG